MSIAAALAIAPKTSETDRIEASLVAALFHSMDAEGVYGRTALYESVVESLSAFISRQREPATEVFRFPPMMSRRHIEKAGYLKSFPNLLGCVCALHGSVSD